MNFEELVRATEAVRDAIGEGRWLEAAELETTRRQLLEKYVRHQSDLEKLTERLAELSELTHHVIGETLHHQRQLERTAFTVQKGRKAIDVYSSAVHPNP